jgi:hypothetical protein
MQKVASFARPYSLNERTLLKNTVQHANLEARENTCRTVFLWFQFLLSDFQGQGFGRINGLTVDVF